MVVRLATLAALVLGLPALAPGARAADAAPARTPDPASDLMPDIGLSLMSDAVWRGYSKSQGRASVAVDLTWRTRRGGYLALGLLDRGAGAAVGRWEWTLALGRQWSLDGVHAALADWSIGASVLRYAHTGGPRRLDADYTDLTLAADWRGRLHALLTLSPDTRLGRRSGWNATTELAWHERLHGPLALDVGVGWQDNRGIGSASYGYGSAGLSWSAGPWRTSLVYVGSQAVARGALPRASEPSRWVFSLVLTR